MEVEEIENVVEIVDKEEIVPDPDGETVPVPQCDALWEPDVVPHVLAVLIGDGDAQAVALLDSQLEVVTDEETEAENVDDTVEDGDSVLDDD